MDQGYRRFPDFPIAGVCGVSDAGDVIRFMMSGATIVQMAGVVMVRGYKLLGDIVKSFNEYCDRRGVKAADLIGVAARAAREHHELYNDQRRYAYIDRNLCNDCGYCVEHCFYGGLVEKDGKVMVIDDPDAPLQHRCAGCGLCRMACPKGAVEIRIDKTRVQYVPK